MKRLLCAVTALSMALCLCACARTPEQRALSMLESEFGLDLGGGKYTVRELYYTYDDGNIFGEGQAEYKISFKSDASALFSRLDTLPDINGNDALRLAREIDPELPEPEDGAHFAYKSENNGLNWVLLLYYSGENAAYLIISDS